ncbi:LacI family DNA-binding transcriptional regulator [Cellulosilyticum sp. I15G10I2]|uniref:LacI family DNA-binding transcriptional regulator n=1 Tax=Cellulosilyticum sp. I15G10I2 TaxID=1892843 RepID=UPI00085BFA80|nr:LacI family DNA-binding transcriptional regulator [Cellulosilyticum sp. I15G10I2]
MTIKEIANIAGVSPTAVSLVLNNKKGVGKETRKQILDLLDQYHYPLPKKAGTVPKNILFLKYIKHGMIVEENAGFISAIMDSIENDCRSQGYNLSIVISENRLEETLQDIDYTAFHGLILLGTELDFFSYPLLEKIPIPYIVVDNVMPNFHCNAIAISNHEIVYHALSHLASLGHKDIAYFRSNISIQNFDERAISFEESAKQLNLSFDISNKFLLTPTLLGAYESMKNYLSRGLRLPRCAFADNDTIAIGAMKALNEFKYKIPHDIAVIGFDDIHFSAINSPSLSTMSVPKKLMGSLALRHLHATIEDASFQNVKTRIGGTIVIRHSTHII